MLLNVGFRAIIPPAVIARSVATKQSRGRRAPDDSWIASAHARNDGSASEPFGLKPHHLARPHALVGGEDDAKRVDRVLEVLAEIDLAANGLEEQALLALA
jgi:hypothetical protein